MAIVGASWTYSGDPATDSKDAVRALIGDVDERRQYLSDEQILFALSERSNKFLAAALACRMIGAGVRGGSKSVGDVSISQGEDIDKWEAKAKAYENMAALGLGGGVAIPYVGGISKQAKSQIRTDQDLIKASFTVGQFDNPSGVRNSTGENPLDYWST